MNPTRPHQQIRPPRVVNYQRPSHRQNQFTQRHFQQAGQWNQNWRSRHPGIYNRVRHAGNVYNHHYLSRLNQRYGNFRGYYHNNSYRYWHSPWFRYGFRGGYYYPVRPCYTISTYFSYPVVYWFYVQQPDPEYYQSWYPAPAPSPTPAPTPAPQPAPEPFQFASVFFPTDTLKDMLVEVSGMEYLLQNNFRSAITVATSSLLKQIQETMSDPFQFEDNDIVVNHYENLGNQAIVLEGFVDRGELHVPFKMFLNLQQPSESSAFLPNGQEPTPEEINKLEAMNAQIKAFGGDPYTAAEEPETSSEQNQDDELAPVDADEDEAVLREEDFETEV